MAYGSQARNRTSEAPFWIISKTTAIESVPALKISGAFSGLSPRIAASGMSRQRPTFRVGRQIFRPKRSGNE